MHPSAKADLALLQYTHGNQSRGRGLRTATERLRGAFHIRYGLNGRESGSHHDNRDDPDADHDLADDGGESGWDRVGRDGGENGQGHAGRDEDEDESG